MVALAGSCIGNPRNDCWTVTYVVYQAGRPECAIIDSVLDFDPKAGRTSTTSADKVIAFVRERRVDSGDPRPCRPSLCRRRI
jgi:hypothetical protein